MERHIVGIMVADIQARFHNQPFIMRRAIWRHICLRTHRLTRIHTHTHTRIHTRTRTHTHTHTIKPPTAGVQLVGHTSINKTVKEKDLGVTMNANTKVSEQFRIAASKGNQVLGMIRRNVTYHKSLIASLCKAIVRPHLE